MPARWQRTFLLISLLALGAVWQLVECLHPPLLDFADLDLDDPVSAQAIAIGRELRACLENTSLVAGVLIVVREGGRVEPYRFYQMGSGDLVRYRQTVTFAVLDALSAGSRAGTLRPGTILHYGLGDQDVFVPSPATPTVDKLAREYPNLFWLHSNPTVVNKTLGTIGTRVVPIPDYEAVESFRTFRDLLRLAPWVTPLRMHADATAPRSALASSAKPWRQRSASVAWRGSTTGRSRDYRDTDRYRVVDAFLNYEKTNNGKTTVAANVKFGGVVQGVTEASLPPRAIGGWLSAAAMMNSRVLLDIDGNANAWSAFRWKLLAGAAVVKVDPRRYIQWYYPWLRHGRDVWVVPVPQAGEGDQAQVVRDAVTLAMTGGEDLARNAEAFARLHLTPPRALAAIYDILSDLEPYRDDTRSWTIPR